MNTKTILVFKMVDVIDEYADRYKTYGQEIIDALQLITNFWSHVPETDEFASFDAYAASVANSMKTQAEEDQRTCSLNLPFCVALEKGLINFATPLKEDLSSVEFLNGAIEHYKKITTPKAFALLASLARESDIDYSKRKKEKLIKRTADAVESAAALGVHLPPIMEDIRDFSHARFANLASQIPKGQSIIDFYILNQIRHRLSKYAPEMIEEIRLNGIPRNVFFGSLELATPMAEVMSVEGADEYLVILSRGLWTGTGLASGIIAKCVELDTKLFVPCAFHRSTAKELTSSLKLLDKVLTCALAETEYPIITDENHKKFWKLLDSSTKGFVFGHEYAHVILGHIEKNQTAALDTTHLWNQEFLADIVAIQLNLRDKQVMLEEVMSASNTPEEFKEQLRSYLGGVQQFHVVAGAVLTLYLIQRMQGLQGIQSTSNSSHPPIQMRINSIWTFIKMNADPETFNKIFHFANLMIRDFFSLLSPMLGTWRDYFEDTVFRLLMSYSIESVLEAVDYTNTDVKLSDESLEPHRAHLTELFKDPSADYEEKYSIREDCITMINMYRDADPFWSIKESIKANKAGTSNAGKSLSE